MPWSRAGFGIFHKGAWFLLCCCYNWVIEQVVRSLGVLLLLEMTLSSEGYNQILHGNITNSLVAGLWRLHSFVVATAG